MGDSYQRAWYKKNRFKKLEQNRLWRLAHPDRMLTYQQKQCQRNLAFIRRYKENKPCTDCGGFFDVWQMDFDHIRGTKRSDVGSLGHSGLKTLLKEIAKCELVCANCHRTRTYRRRQLSCSTN